MKKEEFLSIFRTEAREHLEKMNKGLLELERDPENSEILQDLLRYAHTLKGAAKMMGFDSIKDIVHQIEEIFSALSAKKISFSPEMADKVFSGLDTISNLLDPKIEREVDTSMVQKELIRTKEREVERKKMAFEPSAIQMEEFIRIPVSRVNSLFNLIGEIVVNRTTSAQNAESIKEIKRMIEEARDAPADRIKPAFDEVLKRMSEILDQFMREASSVDPIIDRLSDLTREIRMLPISTILSGFGRFVRDLCKEQEKRAELFIYGEDTELDKKLLEEIKDPLIHILRNCIDHGIEREDERKEAGKDPVGRIEISARHEGSRVFISITDDGRGLRLDKIKEKAIERGLVTPYEAERLKKDEIISFIFAPNFSTSERVTEISGRGVGMDVVRDHIERLKGKVEVKSEEGRGCTFLLSLPLTISVIDVLLIRSLSEMFAIPLLSIFEITKVKPSEISTTEQKMAIESRGELIPLVYLSCLSSENAVFVKKDELDVVVILSLGKKVGFVVDEIVGKDEIFIKPLPQELEGVKNVSGAAILNTGEMVLVLEPQDLIQESSNAYIPSFVKTEDEKKRILVVEDSITTRELEKMLLEAEGYSVETACDGVEALERLEREEFALLLLDIDLPRMDGFSLCSKVREKDREIPIIMLTTYESEDDKKRGLEVGASAYIKKSSFNSDSLLDTIKRLIVG